MSQHDHKWGLEKRYKSIADNLLGARLSAASQKNYICPACQEYFRSDGLYREHYKKAHSAQKLVKISYHEPA